MATRHDRLIVSEAMSLFLSILGWLGDIKICEHLECSFSIWLNGANKGEAFSTEISILLSGFVIDMPKNIDALSMTGSTLIRSPNPCILFRIMVIEVRFSFLLIPACLAN